MQRGRGTLEQEDITRIVLICMGCSLVGFLIGLSLAGRIADHKLAEMRLEAGLETPPKKKELNEDPLKDWEDLFKQD